MYENIYACNNYNKIKRLFNLKVLEGEYLGENRERKGKKESDAVLF